jgi:hypothetical protein
MADDNNKKQYTEEQKKYLKNMEYVQSPETLKKKGISEVGPPIRPGASNDSTGYFAKKVDSIRNTRMGISADFMAAKRKNGIIDALENKERVNAQKKLGIAEEQAKENYLRQRNKGDKGVILNYDKNGYAINPLSSKKEIKPAAIVAPVKRPSEAVMKKLTDK